MNIHPIYIGKMICRIGPWFRKFSCSKFCAKISCSAQFYKTFSGLFTTSVFCNFTLPGWLITLYWGRYVCQLKRYNLLHTGASKLRRKSFIRWRIADMSLILAWLQSFLRVHFHKCFLIIYLGFGIVFTTLYFLWNLRMGPTS